MVPAASPAGTIGDGGQIVVTDLLPGTYTSTETVPTGWGLMDISCDDEGSTTPSFGDLTTATATFELDAGETITCVFTNTLLGIDVSKVADDHLIPPEGKDVTFTFTVTNTSDVPVEIGSLEDDVFGTLTGDADCQVGTVLPPGGSCEFQQTFFVESDVEPNGDPDQVFPPHVNTFTACVTTPTGIQAPSVLLAAAPGCAEDPETIDFSGGGGAGGGGIQPRTDTTVISSTTASSSGDARTGWLAWILLSAAAIVAAGATIGRQRRTEAVIPRRIR